MLAGHSYLDQAGLELKEINYLWLSSAELKVFS